MCGIAGILRMNDARAIDVDSLCRMMNAQRHRGPDESGVYLDDYIGLGHLRLSIIDLAGGTQPIGNETGSVWVVFNGEIYNYIELRQRLLHRGHRFSTASDTEVLVHLYEDLGPGFVNELNGQWAFALWDKNRHRLLLSRDRTGVRPLHVMRHGKILLFASEIKALFAVPDVSRRIDLRGLRQVCTLWTTLPGYSVFEGVGELEPGCSMLVDDGRIRTERYWDLPFRPACEWHRESPAVLAENIREMLREAVQIRLRADVPVGTYLSGGLDSSGVSAIVARDVNPDLETFGIRFDETPFDEGVHQNAMVDYLGTRHHEVRADVSSVAQAMGDAVWHCEKPLLRTAPVPLMLLSRLVRQRGIKVVLTGEGADEFFGGYDIFKEALVRKFWSRAPESSIRPLLFKRLYPDVFRSESSRRALSLFFGQHREVSDDPVFSHLVRWNATSRIRQFFSPALSDAVDGYDPVVECRDMLPAEFHRLDTLGKAQYLEARIFLSSYLLSAQGDRVAMANAIEVRLPYLDPRLVEYAGRIPSVWRVLGLEEKYILKKALAPLLPGSVTARHKHPYRAPVHRSLMQFCRSEAGRQVLCSQALHRDGLFDARKVELLFKKMDSRPDVGEIDAMALAAVVSTQILAYRFLEAYARPDPIRPDRFIDKRMASAGEMGALGGMAPA